MLRKKIWTILCLFPFVYTHCRGNSLKNYLVFNNTPSDAFKEPAGLKLIENLRITNASATSLTISWQTNRTNCTSYSIKWFKSNKSVDEIRNISFKNLDVEFTIEPLEPCTVYNITVTARTTPRGEASAKSVTGETAFTQPSAPLSLSAKPGKINESVSLNVHWEEPKTGHSCVKFYSIRATTNIYGWNHTVTKDTLGNEETLQNLCACASYEVTLYAVDRQDGKGLNLTIQSELTMSKVTKPPRLINGMNIPPISSTKTSITFNWNCLDRRNNCTIDSVMMNCRLLYSSGYGFEVKEKGFSNMTVENPRVVELTVNNLSPFANYGCYAWTRNVAGWSNYAIPVPFFTQEDVPSAPENFTHVENTQFTFTWDAPTVMPGQLQKYRLTTSWEPLYPVPDYCKVNRTAILQNIRPTAKNYTWKGGEGYSEYTAYLEARTNADWGNKSKSITFRSAHKGAPDKVTNLNYETRPQKNNSNALETVLSWNLPCSLKGQLRHFNLKVFGTRRSSENHSINEFLVIDEINSWNKNKRFIYNFGELRPQYSYAFSVSAAIKETEEEGQVVKYFTEYPAGIPPEPRKNYIKSITLNPEKIRRTSTSFEVLLPLFLNINGDVQYYAILVSQLGFMNEHSSIRFDTSNGNWPDVSSWRESMENDFKLTYQVTEPRWSPYPHYILNYGSIRAVKIVIGDDITCKDVSMATNNRMYCNGPLKPDTWYEVRMRAFTNGGYTDSTSFVVKTEAEIKVAMIIGIVLGILLVGIVASLLLARKSHEKRKRENSTTEEEVTDQDRSRNRQLPMNLPSHSYENSAARTRRRNELSHE